MQFTEAEEKIQSDEKKVLIIKLKENYGVLLPGEVARLYVSLEIILIDDRVIFFKFAKFMLNKCKIHYVNDFSVGIIILRTDDTCKFRSYERYYLSSYFFLILMV